MSDYVDSALWSNLSTQTSLTSLLATVPDSETTTSPALFTDYGYPEKPTYPNLVYGQSNTRDQAMAGFTVQDEIYTFFIHAEKRQDLFPIYTALKNLLNQKPIVPGTDSRRWYLMSGATPSLYDSNKKIWWGRCMFYIKIISPVV